MIPKIQIIQGDCLERLAELPDESVHCCVTSPPYWGLRDYGVAGQIGLEKTPEEYVAKMVAVFREVRRVLRDDATCWINLGDSYNAAGRDGHGTRIGFKQGTNRASANGDDANRPSDSNLKPKDLVGIPWRVAFALQADGWYLRSDIIWHKPNPMPESVTDRPTKAHEYIFLLAKSERYYFDAEAIKEASTGLTGGSFGAGGKEVGRLRQDAGRERPEDNGTRNKRTVWTVATSPYSEAHFATFPPDLIKPCILAGTSAKGCCPKCGAGWERVLEPNGRVQSGGTTERTKGLSIGHGNGGNSMLLDGAITQYKTTGWKPTCRHGEDLSEVKSPIPCTVLDPFGGSGTTGQVAIELGRNAILIELNPQYVKLAEQRTFITPGLPLA